MATKLRPYGHIGRNAEIIVSPYGHDVATVQEFLPKGFRIRNKKKKRRYQKKTTRQRAKQALRRVEHY